MARGLLGGAWPPVGLTYAAAVQQVADGLGHEPQYVLAQADHHAVQELTHARVDHFPVHRHSQRAQEDRQSLGTNGHVFRGQRLPLRRTGALWDVKARLHMRFFMRFRVQNVRHPTLHECFSREASHHMQKYYMAQCE